MWGLHSSLLIAIQENDIEGAKEVLRQESVDADVSFFHNGRSYGTPALCLCVERGLYDMTKLFISYGCSVNAPDDNGYTALHFSCSHQFADIVTLLVSNRANVNAVSNLSQTPLHLASQQSSLEIVKTLVSHGANVNKRDADGKTALSIACICNQTDIVTFLIKSGADVNAIDTTLNSPLLHAVNAGLSLNYELIKVLLEAGADANRVNDLGCSPLFTVIRRSSEHDLNGFLSLEALIEYNVDLNKKHPPMNDETALHLSISRCQDTLTESLIRAGVDVNERNTRDNYSPLHRLSREGKKDLVEVILAAGADVSLPKTFYVDESGVRRDIQDPEIRNLLESKAGKAPSLKHLSRLALRRWLERRADRVIKQLFLPISLKEYLLLLHVD
jgi:serine/threonine-protein phosphatase 6 regulatory ankyrin repeat subunit A